MMLDTHLDTRLDTHLDTHLVEPLDAAPHGCDLTALLRDVGRRRHYPRGSLVFAEGDDAHEVLLITRGTVKVLVTARDGRQVVIDMSDAGELLGELAALDGARRTATAVAVTSVDVVTVPVTTFRQILRETPGAAEAMIDVLAARLRAAAGRHVELGAADAVARVCSRLDEMAVRYGVLDSMGRIVLDTPITQLDLAQWAGLSREAVVKALRSLRSVGWVTIRGRNIVLLDRESIARRAMQ
jgi:CRP/FNR family transcriptional regulator, cyclic AMP receptor protein